MIIRSNKNDLVEGYFKISNRNISQAPNTIFGLSDTLQKTTATQ